MGGTIQIVALDDDLGFLDELGKSLSSSYQIQTTISPAAALKAISLLNPAILLLDMEMPEMTGVNFLKIVKQRAPNTSVIMLTGDSSASSIVEAMKAGASDYVLKDGEDFITNLKFRIAQNLKLKDFEKQSEVLSGKFKNDLIKYKILGNSKVTLDLCVQISRFKNTHAYVLITGENGTGKELVARNLNLQEGRPDRPFIPVNCGAIPANLLESELFGHVKGAFTGAVTNKEGLFVAANGGDIFLDEIGEMPLDMQVKLLRVLQEKVVSPVGSNKLIPIRVRVIAATNRRLDTMMSQGKFREDLYFRLNQISIDVPALRNRKEDILELAQAFARRNLPLVAITKEAAEVLEGHTWPGNIRELSNVIDRACIVLRDTPRPYIRPEHLSLSTLSAGSNEIQVPADLVPNSQDKVSTENFVNCISWIERLFLKKSLEIFKGDNKEVIERLGLSRAMCSCNTHFSFLQKIPG
jgi:two-component system response regulator AtoC